MEIHQALTRSGSIRNILCRHEQGEIFAAEGYAKASGRVGVCIATSGPGATNLVTGLADAMLDSVPLVAITGQVSSVIQHSFCLPLFYIRRYESGWSRFVWICTLPKFSMLLGGVFPGLVRILCLALAFAILGGGYVCWLLLPFHARHLLCIEARAMYSSKLLACSSLKPLLCYFCAYDKVRASDQVLVF